MIETGTKLQFTGDIMCIQQFSDLAGNLQAIVILFADQDVATQIDRLLRF